MVASRVRPLPEIVKESPDLRGQGIDSTRICWITERETGTEVQSGKQPLPCGTDMKMACVDIRM